MAKKRNSTTAPAPKAAQEKQATLQDLLSRDMVDKLKAQANEMKAEEAKQKEEARKRAAEAQKAEQKRLDNDFEHLLNNSKMDWKQFKK
ncbi:YqkE family protein [Paenibacillus sp. GD4]|jgi:hypothetical protein|uniref:YqkE family protein n=1 Tax=Paenibacillus sp. GD4 TaxID=3068890 RepID=UPI0027967031|nr:YqkE family protein [Paenibacillus sp. GD4]MDQ1912492.1 YqkE family protein [Paenibacillus sp. GD4]